jgi:hypothetical protein
MRRLLWVSLALLATAVAVAARGGTDWPGRPKTEPPRLHQKGPPPAWIETHSRSAWLAYGSYCWRTLCVDMIPPAMRKDVPTVSVKRGRLVRIHLAFTPRAAGVLVMRGDRSSSFRLQAERVLTWRPNRAGVALVDVRAQPGSASYLFRLRVLPD